MLISLASYFSGPLLDKESPLGPSILFCGYIHELGSLSYSLCLIQTGALLACSWMFPSCLSQHLQRASMLVQSFLTSCLLLFVTCEPFDTHPFYQALTMCERQLGQD